MENKSSVVIFERASQMLAEANTIQKAKELKDLALTAADWAKRKGLGEQAVQYARAYALEAERKIGEMLKATERAKGAKGQLRGKESSGGYVTLPPENIGVLPTLDELGLSKRESSEAQMLAALPREQFDAVKEGKKSLAQVRKEIKSSRDFGPPPERRPGVMKDPNGKVIPKELLELWGRAQEIQDMCTEISNIRCRIERGVEEKDKLYAEINPSQVKAALDTAYTAIKATMPYCLCPSCQGDGCRACSHRGLIGKFRYDTVIPRELKKK